MIWAVDTATRVCLGWISQGSVLKSVQIKVRAANIARVYILSSRFIFFSLGTRLLAGKRVHMSTVDAAKA